MNKQTLSEFIKEVAIEICNSYCKYPDQYGEDDAEQWELYNTYCKDCPLDRLEAFK